MATREDVDAFDAKAHDLGLDAVSWWRWDTAIDIDVFDNIASHKWDNGSAPIPPNPKEGIKKELNCIKKDVAEIETLLEDL